MEQVNIGPAHGLCIEASRVGQALDSFDWAATTLGHPRTWSPVLRAMAETVLNCHAPMMLAWGDDLSMVYNDGYAEVLVDKHPQAFGRPTPQVWTETWEQVRPMWQQVLQGNPVHVADGCFVLLRHGNPVETWFDFAMTPLREDGKVRGVLVTITETTERRRLSTKLQESEQRFRAMADAMPQMVFSAQPDGTRDYFNQRWNEFAGDVTLTDGGWLTLIHPDDVTRVRKAWAVSIKNRSTYDLQYRLRHRTGEYRWVLARAVPQRDEQGEVRGWWGTCTDVHEQRRINHAHEVSRRRLAATLLAADVGTWVMDLKNNLILSDQNMARLHGLSTEEARGAGSEVYLATVHPQDTEMVRQNYERSATTGAEYQTAYMAGRPGSWRHLHARGMVELDEDGQPSWLSGLVMDVTQQKAAESALREMDQRKDEFLAMLSHELRNPLASISSAAELLPRVVDDRARVESLGKVLQRQVRHMAGLVEDLLDVARVTRGVVTLDTQPLDMVSVAREALEQVAPQTQTKKQVLEVSLPQSPVMVSGDRKRLVQVLGNLLQNASKYTPEDGYIQLELSADHGQAHIVVRDNGVGMNSSLLKSVFDLFVQGERKADRHQGGLGIGLALVKSLVELHGGTVSARSPGEGLGSAFELKLPLVEVPRASAAPTPAPTAAPASPETRPFRILVVDDNKDAANLMAMLLDGCGFEAVEAHTAAEAVEVAKKHLPDACILDIGLPDATGYQLAARIRALPQMESVPLAALTGYGQESDRRAAFASGFNAHFSKPAELAVLHKWLEETFSQLQVAAD